MERGIDSTSIVHCHAEGVRDTIIAQCFQALGEAEIIFFWYLMHSFLSMESWILVAGGLVGKVKYGDYDAKRVSKVTTLIENG